MCVHSVGGKKKSFSTLLRGPKTSFSLLLSVLLNGHSLYIMRGRDEKDERERNKEDESTTERKKRKKKE